MISHPASGLGTPHEFPSFVKSPAASCTSGRAVTISLIVRLERQPPSHLPVARKLLCGRLPECACPVRQIAVKSSKVDAVKDVEELESHLEVDPLGQMRDLVSIHIRFNEVWLSELIGFFIPLSAKC